MSSSGLSTRTDLLVPTYLGQGFRQLVADAPENAVFGSEHGPLGVANYGVGVSYLTDSGRRHSGISALHNYLYGQRGRQSGSQLHGRAIGFSGGRYG